jgi:PAS domain S-box-containing protein
MLQPDNQGTTATEQQKVQEQSEERFRLAFEHAAVGIAYTDLQGRFLQVNSTCCTITGYSSGDLTRMDFLAITHPQDRQANLELRQKMLDGEIPSFVLEKRYLKKDGSIFWGQVSVSLVRDRDGTPLYSVAIIEDITMRKQAEQLIQRQQERQQILDRASEKLIASLNYQVTLPEIVQMIVPALADYCRIALLDEEQQIKDIVAHHIDPQKIALVQELYEQYKDRTGSTYGIQRLLETGRPELISHVTDEVIRPIAQENPEVPAIIHALGLQSYMGTPLVARGRIIGALTFSSTQPHRHYTQDDLLFAQELARRIALTLDNAYHYQQAQEAISLRDDFLSMASHELKTPLTSLKMFTQIVQRQLARKGEESLSQTLAKMDAQLNKLTMLISDLLNVSKIEHGQLALQMDAFDLDELVREMVAQVQLTGTSHTIRVEGSITRPVWGNRDRIGQVVLNLLSNAIKYSPGADTVIVRLTSETDAASVSVQDFGIGIAPEHQSKIFTRFYRVSGPEEKTFPGLGIGLYLSQEILKRHGSKLMVESEKGKGSLFRFTLPYSSAAS